MASLIGYARVSTQDQNLDLQINALKAAGCQAIYMDKTSGAKAHKKRRGFSKAISRLKEGDTLVVWKIDRLGRTVAELIQITGLLERKQIHLLEVIGGMNTSGAAGKFFFHIMAAVAEMERSMGIERTRAGLEAARRRGAILGRPKAIGPWDEQNVNDLLTQGHSVKEVANAIGVHASTVYRYKQRVARKNEKPRECGAFS